MRLKLAKRSHRFSNSIHRYDRGHVSFALLCASHCASGILPEPTLDEEAVRRIRKSGKSRRRTRRGQESHDISRQGEDTEQAALTNRENAEIRMLHTAVAFYMYKYPAMEEAHGLSRLLATVVSRQSLPT
jgi:hypothetical protein